MRIVQAMNIKQGGVHNNRDGAEERVFKEFAELLVDKAFPSDWGNIAQQSSDEDEGILSYSNSLGLYKDVLYKNIVDDFAAQIRNSAVVEQRNANGYDV